MDAKLTLKLEKEVIDRAKAYARRHDSSLSRLVESLLRGITMHESEGVSPEITPRVERLSGVLGCIPDLDEKEAITDYLMEKHR